MSRKFTEDEISLLMSYLWDKLNDSPVCEVIQSALQDVDNDEVEEILEMYPKILREAADKIQKTHENLNNILDELTTKSELPIERS
jgi:hypothetical protein